MFELQNSICDFVNKLAIFVTRAKTGDFGLFPRCKEFLATTDSEMPFPSVKQELVQTNFPSVKQELVQKI